MEIQTIWLIILAISPPIAGIVGFSIQLRNTKKLRLENEKLQLEINQLKLKAERENRRIIEPTNAEVEKFSRTIRYKFESINGSRAKRSMFSGFSSGEIFGILLFLFLTVYFIYDLYRLGSWVWSLF